MSDSGESVDHEVEVRAPKSVSLDESGQGDALNDNQKIQEDELNIEMENLDFAPRMNARCQSPTPESHQFYPGRPIPLSTPSFQTLGATFNMKPEPFSGKESWEEYLSHFEDCAELSRWTDREKVLFLAASLRDQARSYYMSLSLVERRSYEILVNKFSQRFGSSRHQNKWLSRLEMRKRQPGETVAALGDDIRQMSQKAYCNLNEKAQEALALNHLYKIIPVEMKCRCIDRDCQSISDAVDVIERYEAILGENYDKKKQNARAVSSSSDTKSNFPGNNPSTQNLKAQKEESDTSKVLQDISSRLERLERSSQKSTAKRCFHCNSPAHFIKDCPHHGAQNPSFQNGPRNQESTNSRTKQQSYNQGNGKSSAW